MVTSDIREQILVKKQEKSRTSREEFIHLSKKKKEEKNEEKGTRNRQTCFGERKKERKRKL